MKVIIHDLSLAIRFGLVTAGVTLILGLLSEPVVGQVPGKDEAQIRLSGKPNVAPSVVTQTKAPTDAIAAFRAARVIYVRSTSLLVGASVIENKLRKRGEFQQLGLQITRDVNAADLILELKHDLFTMYVYTAIEPNSNVVVASGKLSSLGGTVAGKVAKRFLKQLMRAQQP